MDREATEPYGTQHDPAPVEPLRPGGDMAATQPKHATPRPPEHPVRARIHAYVTAHPGAHMGDLVRDLRLGWGNAHHHLDHMERKAQIVREAEGNRVRLFVPGQVPVALRHAYAVLKNECLRDTFRAVVDRPGIIQRDVAASLGVTPTAARKHLRRLTDEGLIRTERAGNRVRYWAAADAVGLEVRLWLRYGRLGEASPKRDHPNDPFSEAGSRSEAGPQTARFDGSQDLGQPRATSERGPRAAGETNAGEVDHEDLGGEGPRTAQARRAPVAASDAPAGRDDVGPPSRRTAH